MFISKSMEDKARPGKAKTVTTSSRTRNDKSSTKSRKFGEIKFLVAGIVIIALGNFFLKYLELSNLHRNGLFLTDYFTIVNSRAYLDSLLNAPWKLLLPVEIGPESIRWTTTGMIPLAASNHLLGVDTTFYLLNTLLIVSSLLTSWFVFRSKVFSLTLAICMGFGTQLLWHYNNSSIALLYLFVIYAEINLLALYYIFKRQNHQILFKTIFILSLIALALCWEMWLDYFVFLFLFSLILFFIFRKRKKEVFLRQTRFILISSVCIVFVYFLVKLTYSSGISEHFTKGHEGETILNYLINNHSINYVIIAVEDMISNIITYNYIALTNYFPLPFMFSLSLVYLGKDAIISNQYGLGRAPGLADFVYNHYVFLWYLGAGILFAILCYFLLKYLIQSFKNPTPHSLILSSLLLMIATGAFTHDLIRYRYYLSLPIFSYKCIVSIVGVSLLISYLLMYLQDRIRNKKKFFLVLGASWLVIVIAGFTKPALLSNILSLLEVKAYPNPLMELAIRLHHLLP